MLRTDRRRPSLPAAAWLVLAVAPLLSAGPASAQTTRPAATAPLTQTAATPRDALRLLNVAMRDGNREQIRAVMDARTPLEHAMVDAMASMAEALAGLQRAATAAFGPDGARDVTGDDGSRWAEGMARIESADVNLDGDDVATVLYRAAVRPPHTQQVVVGHATKPPATTAPAGQPTTAPSANAAPPPAHGDRSEPVTLRKMAGGWRMPVSQLAPGVDPAALEQRLAELAVQTKLVADVTAEIAAGKYATAEQAADAWHSRFMQSLGPKPATRPAGK